MPKKKNTKNLNAMEIVEDLTEFEMVDNVKKLKQGK